MRYTYTPVELVEFQQEIMNEVNNPEITLSRSGNEYTVEFPNKSPYRSIHDEVHESKGAIGSEFRQMKFKGIESQNEVSENEEVRKPDQVDKSTTYVDIGFEVKEFTVFGNGSVVRVPILSW